MTEIAVDHIQNHLKAPPFQNQAIHFATKANNSEAARLDAGFQEDFIKVLAGNCIYLKNFLGKENDRTIMNGLVDDLVRANAIEKKNDDEEKSTDVAGEGENKNNNNNNNSNNFSNIKKATKTDKRPPPKKSRYDDDDNNDDKTKQNQQSFGPKTKLQDEGDTQRIGLQDWAQHQMFNQADKVSPTFNALVDFLANYFSCEVHASRLNYYADNKKSWKQYHHDSHAYSKKHNAQEDITIGLSFGHTRELSFLHEATNRKFGIPQANCDLFAFTSDVNSVFQHGVPRDTCGSVSEIPRLSLIVWGRRQTLNERNGGAASIPKSLMDKLSKFAVSYQEQQAQNEHKVIRMGNNNNNNNSQQQNDINSNTQQQQSKALKINHQNEDGSLTDDAKNCVIEVAKSLVSSREESRDMMFRKESSTASTSSATTGAPAKKKKKRLQ